MRERPRRAASGSHARSAVERLGQPRLAEGQGRGFGELVRLFEERLHEGSLASRIETQQREQALGDDARLILGDERSQAQQRRTRAASVARDGARRRDPHGRLRVGQELREQRQHVAAAGLRERERRGAAQVDRGVDASAEHGLHLHVAGGATVELSLVLAEAAQSLDDRRLGAAARIALRQVREEARERRHQLGHERLELELRDERRRTRDGVRSLARQHAPQLGP